ncbi:MAG: SRPBCC family protein [Actinomycetes bacterium]
MSISVRLSEFRMTVDLHSLDQDLQLDHVWEKLVDWKGQSEWMIQTKVWSDSTDFSQERGLGVQVFAFTGLRAQKYPASKILARCGILDQMVVTTWQPPTLCEVDHVGSVIKGRGVFRLEKIESGVRFHWFEEIKAPWPILLVIRPAILIGVFLSLRRFGRFVSAR